MKTIENFILNYKGEQRTVIEFLHNYIIDFPKVYVKFNYNLPFYYRNSWICYLNPKKDGGVDLAFCKGKDLSNEQGLLEDKGRTLIKSVTFYNVKEIPLETVNEVLQEAFLIDEQD